MLTLRGSARQKNATIFQNATIFLSTFFKKCPKTVFFLLFIQKFDCGAENYNTILKYPYFVTDPKNFLKAPIYTNFEGGARAEKTQFFWSKFSKKCLKTPFLTLFFSKVCLRCRNFCQNRGKTVLWESSKNQFGPPKKKVPAPT